MATLSGVDITSLLLVEGTAPSNPASGKDRLFVRSSDHLLCLINSAGTVTPYGGALANPMTTKGDVILGDTGGTPTRLGAGTATYVLTSAGAGAFPTWSAPAAGALTLITDTVMGIDTAAFDFTSIPATYKHLKIILSGRSTQASTSEWVKCQFNGDTTGNYDTFIGQFFAGFTNAGSGDTIAGSAFAYLLGVPGANGVASDAGGGELTIPDYAGTTFLKFIHGNGYLRKAASTTNLSTLLTGGTWRSTAAINEVKLFPANGSWKTGSRASLYGIS